MNRVYKVIWSKAKHCYVVTSEIAKSHTKGESTGRGLKKLAAALLVAAALMGPNFAWAADDMATVKDTNGVDQIVYTVEGAERKLATKAELNAKANAVDVASTYVKNDDAKVGADGTCVKAAYTVGQNLSALDEQVKNYTVTVLEVGEKVDKNFTDLYAKVQTNADAVTAEETARKQADQNNLKIDGDGEILKVKEDSTEAVKKLVLNKDGGNQITLSDGFYAGGDDYDHAGAALKWDGSIKGAAGDFTVDTKGKVTAASGKIGTVEITSAGAVSGVTDLTVNGTFDSKTLSSTVVPDINYTTINGGKTVSMNQKNDVKTGETQASASTFDENGSNAWAKDDDSIGKSSMTADKISQSLSDTGDHPSNAASRVLSQNKDKYEIADVVSGKDGENNYNSYITQNMNKILQKIEDGDGHVLTSTEQTETGIKSIATDGKNNASTNLSNNGFNTFASDGTNKTYTKQTAVDIKNTAKNGMISNTAKNLVNTASENMTNTVGKNLTTTVGGDSSLTAENITNEAKNKITNKALDVETDAASSIVSKVSNDYGSNTSTQLSHQTMEEMKAEGKTASYLRGAAEEKSQLTDGAKKTTIDTVAGQTNTNITEGKNVSNSL